MAAAVAVAVLAGAAPAQAIQSAIPEPQFTKPTPINGGAAGNTWWFEWQYPADGYYRYCLGWGAGIREGTQLNGPNPPNSLGCSHYYINGQAYDNANQRVPSADLAVNTKTYPAVQLSGTGFFPAGQSRHACILSQVFLSGAWQKYIDWTCETSFADPTPPSGSLTLDGGAQFTRDLLVSAQVSYQDQYSPPFINNNNWGVFPCLVVGSSCSPNTSTSPGFNWCTPPPQSSSSSWTACERSLPGGADGQRAVCVRLADSAIADQQNLQTVKSSGNGLPPQFANLSSTICDTITLDTTAPSLEIAASDPTPEVGQAVTFTATASDATSGLAGPIQWNLADGKTGAGNSVTHTYGSAGARSVAATAQDRAGHERTVSTQVTVAEPDSGPDPDPTPGPGPDPDPNQKPGPGGGGGAEGVTAAAPKSQRVGKNVVLELVGGCAESCNFSAGGAVKVSAAEKRSAGAAAKARSYKLKPASAQIAAGDSVTLRLKLAGSKTKAKRTTKAIKRAIKRGATASAKLAIEVTDRAGSVVSLRRTIKLAA